MDGLPATGLGTFETTFTHTFAEIYSDSSITATFARHYTIVATAGDNGTISPIGVTMVAEGADQGYIFTPDDCYEVDDVTVNGLNYGFLPDYTFQDISRNHEIHVTFKKQTFTIIATAGANGRIDPSGEWKVDCGDDVNFTITPDHCYEIFGVWVSIDGGDPVQVLTTDVDVDSLTRVGTYTIANIRNNYTIEVTFALSGPFIVTARAGEGGTISPKTAEVPCGASLTVKITPEYCHVIADVKVTRGVGDPVSVMDQVKADTGAGDGSSTYILTDITTNCRIDAVFMKLGPFDVVVDVKPDEDRFMHGVFALGECTDFEDDEQFSYGLPEHRSVECGEDLEIVIRPYDCYEIDDVIVTRDGKDPVSVKDELVECGKIGDIHILYSYVLRDVLSDCSVEIRFRRLMYTVDASFRRDDSLQAIFSITLFPQGTREVECGKKTDFTLNIISPGFATPPPVEVVDIIITRGDSAPVSGKDKLKVSRPLPGHPTGYEYTLTNVRTNCTVLFVIDKTVQPGDMDSDGKLTSADALMVLKIVEGELEPTDEQRLLADVNGDGKIDSNDARIILRRSVGYNNAPYIGPIGSGDGQVSVMLPYIHGVAGQTVTAPVLMDGAGLLSNGEICISYKSSVLRAVGASFDSSALVAVNTAEPGIIRIAFASASVLGQETLAKIRFDVLADDVSLLKFRDADLYRPDTHLLDAEKMDGRFESWNIPAEHTALLQNFPNPFNPETWIPYQLAEDTEVSLQIFSIQGKLVRRLNLGYKPAGSYVSQDRAVYWDGRNENGETAANGIYFYSIQTDDYTAIKKMVVAQ